MACREAGIAAIDAVFSDINDIDGLRDDVKLSRNLGFDGKTVVHPRQIDVVNDAFAPSAKEVSQAIRILATLDEGRRQHKGVITLDGSMLDKPMEIRAISTLKREKYK